MGTCLSFWGGFLLGFGFYGFVFGIIAFRWVVICDLLCDNCLLGWVVFSWFFCFGLDYEFSFGVCYSCFGILGFLFCFACDGYL